MLNDWTSWPFWKKKYEWLKNLTFTLFTGHAGHDESERRHANLLPLKKNKPLYSLDGQIQHKVRSCVVTNNNFGSFIWLTFDLQVEFIRQFIPNDVKITLIAHSIGSYIALKLFKINDINQRIQQCCLLFPTFEYMAAAPNGKIYINTLQFYFKLSYYGAKLLDLFPLFFRAFCVRVVLWIRNIPSAFVDVTLMLVRPSVLSKIVFMADGEMDDVLEPDYTTIAQNKSRLRFIYSTSDGWTPATYYQRLKAQIPDIKAHLTDRFEHTFTLKSSYIELADCLAPWILSSQAFPEERLWMASTLLIQWKNLRFISEDICCEETIDQIMLYIFASVIQEKRPRWKRNK